MEGSGEAQNWWRRCGYFARNMSRWAAALASRQSHQRFIQTLKARPPARRLPSRVLFAFRVTASVSLQRIAGAGKHIEIHLLFTNPCRYYWGILKTQPRWQNLHGSPASSHFEDRHLPLFRENQNWKPYLTATVNRISVIRYHGEKLGRIISTCYLNWKTAVELDAFC